MWIDEIAEHIDTLPITGKPDVTHVQTLPAGVDLAMMIAAPLTGMGVDPELPGFHKGPFQLVVRHRTAKEAEELAQRVSDAVETEIGVDLTKVHINYIRPRHLAVSFPRSDGDYFEAVVNFDLCFYRLSA